MIISIVESVYHLFFLMVPSPRAKTSAAKSSKKAAKKSPVTQPKTAPKTSVKKTTPKVVKKPEAPKKAAVMKEINEVEREMKELSRDVADVNYNMSSMILAILIVAIMALGGYFYSMSSSRESVEMVAPLPSALETRAVPSSVPSEVVNSLLAQVAALTPIESDVFVSAHIIKDTTAPQTYQVGDYVFVFENKMIVYRAETNKVQSVVSFLPPAPVVAPLPPQ